MQYLQHIITRYVWLIYVSVLGVALACDQFMGGALTLGVVLVCALRIVGFVLDTFADRGGQS